MNLNLIKNILLTSLLLTICIQTQAQFFSPGFFPGGHFNRFGYNPNGLWGVPFVSYESAGRFFWNEDWHIGRAVLKDKKIVEGYKLRYDLGNNQLEVMVNNDIKVLPLKELHYFEWVYEEDSAVSFFVNGLDYKIEGVGLVGICEVLTMGMVQLFMKRDVNISRDNYVTGFNNARSVERGNARTEFYLAEGNRLLPITKKEKDNLIQFGEKGDEIKSFVKRSKLRWKKPEDLIKIVDYYNQLLQVSN
ncbi:MAG: hypothetical protein AAGI07_15590 [Bacteroidota bacterium]